MKSRRTKKTKRAYWGAPEAGEVVLWLNGKTRPSGDPVEGLIKLNEMCRDPSQAIERRRDPWHDIRQHVATTVRKWRFSFVPVVVLSPSGWKSKLQHQADGVGGAQLLAFANALELSNMGLLHRVRICRRPGCGVWFFAKSGRNHFCAIECERELYRSTPEWRAMRAAYMRHQRRIQKEQDEAGVKNRENGREAKGRPEGTC